MLKCRRCGKSLTKFDKDICPYCGLVKPLDGQEDNTEDVTQFIESTNLNKENLSYKPKKILVYSLLLMFLGIFAAHLFYIKSYFKSVFLLVFNLIFIGMGGYLLSLLDFSVFEGQIYFYWVISFAVLFIIYFILGIVVFIRKQVVDNNNQLLR